MATFFRRCVGAFVWCAVCVSFVYGPVLAAAHTSVRYALVAEPTTLNPLYLSGSWYTIVSELAFEPLMRLGPGNRLVPGLATEEPTLRNGGISADGRRITFHVRRGTTWADGVPVTADDVTFAIDQINNPANDIGSRTGYDRIRAVRTPDRWTVEFDFARPEPAALTTLALMTPLPKHLLSGLHDLNHVPYDSMPVGNGPYSVVAWKRADVVRLMANPRYWRGRPAVPEIDVKIVPSSATAILQMRTHEIDLSPVAPSMISQLPPVSIVRRVAPSLAWTELAFNFSKPALADLRVRRALALAIDRVKLARVVGRGMAKSDHVMQPLFLWALDPSVAFPAFDAASANRLLDEAGWKIGPRGVRQKGNATLQMTMVYPAGGDSVLPATIAANLEAVHVRVEQKSVQSSLLYDTARAGGILAGGKFDLAILGLQTNPTPGVAWLFACDQRAPNGFNYWHYCNAKLDADSNRAESTFESSRRMRAFSAVQRKLVDDVVFLPLFRTDRMWAYADWLHGIALSPYGPFWNAYAWHVSATGR